MRSLAAFQSSAALADPWPMCCPHLWSVPSTRSPEHEGSVPSLGEHTLLGGTAEDERARRGREEVFWEFRGMNHK